MCAREMGIVEKHFTKILENQEKDGLARDYSMIYPNKSPQIVMKIQCHEQTIFQNL